MAARPDAPVSPVEEWGVGRVGWGGGWGLGGGLGWGCGWGVGVGGRSHGLTLSLYSGCKSRPW